MTIIAVAAILAATVALGVARYHANRADNLEILYADSEERVQSLNQQVELAYAEVADAHAYVEAVEARNAYLESIQMHRQAAAAGQMLVRGAVNVREVLRVVEGGQLP